MTARASSSGSTVPAPCPAKCKKAKPSSSFVAALNRMHGRERKLDNAARSKVKSTASHSSSKNVTSPYQGKRKATPSAFVAALNRRHRRGRKPQLSRTSPHARKAPRRPSYASAARLQPKMWTVGGQQGQAKAPTTPRASRHMVVRKRSRGKISGEEPPLTKPQEHEETPDHSPAATTAVTRATEEPSRKKPRRLSLPPVVSPSTLPASPSFLTSDLLRRRYGGGGRLVRRRPLGKAVAFADPLVTEVRFRPRTPPQDVPFLFYNRSDELRFRNEERLRRSLRTLGVCGADSDDDEATEQEESDAEEEVVAVVVSTSKDAVGHQDKSPLFSGSTKGEMVDPNEITESDDSSSSSDEDSDTQ